MSPAPRSALERMVLHVEALYCHDPRGRLLHSNEWTRKPAPRIFLGRTATGNLWRARADLPDDLVAELAGLCEAEPVEDPPAARPRCGDALLDRLERHAPVERVWTGPAFALPDAAVLSSRSRALSPFEGEVLRGSMEDWLEDVPHRQPFHAALEGGRAVAVCASVRITPDAHEAGVETRPEFRRRGHALDVVAGWAASVRARAALPLYSTSWDNAASRAVAARLGFRPFGVDFHVT